MVQENGMKSPPHVNLYVSFSVCECKDFLPLEITYDIT